jgi:hypothetical protein
MALPISGAWKASRANVQQYTGATRWGTGNNPVHEVYGEGPPLRTTGRTDGPDSPTPALSDIPPDFESSYMWGYTPEDITTQGYYEGMIPALGTTTSELRGTTDTGFAWNPDDNFPSVGEDANVFREQLEMDPQLWSGTRLASFPTETVTEGWRNKQTGAVEDANTSDPAQYERQTSMQQVNPAAGRNNSAALARGTDSPRFNIMTRLTGQKIKPWSQGQRNEDMFPYQQDAIMRPFWFRTAGTDNPAKLEPNSMASISPVQRQPPPDPYLGPEETDIEANGYGYAPITGEGDYTQEDVLY